MHSRRDLDYLYHFTDYSEEKSASLDTPPLERDAISQKHRTQNLKEMEKSNLEEGALNSDVNESANKKG